MKQKLLLCIATVVLLLFSNTSFSQTPNSTLNLGILESFEAYTADGGVTNAGGTVTGDVGTHSGIISGFPSPPNIGNSYTADASTNQARYDLLRLYIHLNSKAVNFPNAFSPFQPAHAAVFTGTLNPGVYAIGSAGSISGTLTLDGGGDPDAVFVIKMNGALTVAASSTVILTNGAKSSNVFWLINGAISVAAGSNVKGTLFSKAGAVGLGAGVILEGRMLSLGGALTMGVGSSANIPSLPCTIPIFCESGCAPAPAVDVLGVLSNFVLFAKAGAIGNTGLSGINGIIAANTGSVAGYALGVHIGSEQIANALTLQAAADLDAAYDSLMAMTPSVTHAATFLNETLAPGVYHIPTAGALGGVIILDAANDPDAIFVFRFAGAFNIAAASKIILANGARRCNVFWLGGAGVATGALNIGASCEVQGTFISHGGACNSGAGVFMSGRQISTLGAVNTDNPVIYGSPECVTSVTLKTTAVADSPSVAAGTSAPSVIANDISKGVQAVIGTLAGQVTLTFTNTATLTMNPDGTITVAANASAGIYPISYTICEVSNPTICSTVTSNVTVTALAAAIVTNDDTGVSVYGVTGGTSFTNVLVNDTFNDQPVLASQVNTTFVSSTNAGITLAGTDVMVAAGTLAGTYQLVYQICEKLNPSNCNTATVTVLITDGVTQCNTVDTLPFVSSTFDNLTTSSSTSGLCLLGCGITNVARLIDGDLTNYAKVTTALGVGVTHKLRVTDGNTIYAAGTFAGYRIAPSGGLLSANLLNTISIKTYLGGVLKETITGNSLVSIVLLTNGNYDIGFNTSQSFDAIEISITSLVGATTSTNIYYPVIRNYCAATVECYKEYALTNPVFPVTIDGAKSGITGVACLTCAVNDINNVLTASTTDYATISLTAGISATASIAVADQLFTYPMGTFAGFTIKDLNTLVQLNLFQSLSISTYNNGVLQETKGASGLIDLTLLGGPILGSGSGFYNVGFQTTLAFDEIRLSVNSLVSVINTINVYGAFVDTHNSNGGSLNCFHPIIALNDTNTTTINGTNGGDTGINVFANDTLNGTTVNPAAVVLTSTPNGTLTVNSNGSVSIAANTPAGTYTISYTICEVNNPSNCSASTTVTVTVTAPAIVAVVDTPSVLAGTNTPSVILNDTVNGVQAVIGTAPGQVTLTFTNNGPLTMNTDGTITVAANTIAGTYTISYTICEVNNPTNCNTVQSTITVTNPASVGGTSNGNQIICKDSTPNDMTITGNTGSVVKWQKSIDLLFSSPTDILITSTTLSGVLIGNISETTYFRAVVQDGSSLEQYSPVVTVTIPSTTWDGVSWSNGAPIITTTAFITGNYSVTANILACTLTVSNGAIVAIPSGSNVTLYGKLTVAAGSSFTLNSNSNLIQQTDAVNTGDITVKRMSSPMYRLDYTLWSSPVSGSQTLLNFSPLTSNVSPSNIRFYSYNTATNQYNNLNPAATVFEGAKSYLIRSPNNWIAYNVGLSPAPQQFTGSFTGVPRNGTIPFTMANTGTGYNAVGNPFPSAISLDGFINDNSNAIEGTLWFWRKFNEDNNLTSYTACTTVGCTTNNNATYIDSDFISVGQGFIVKAKSGQTNLNFTNTMRSSGNVDQFFRTTATTMDRFWLKMTNAANKSTGQNLIAYTPTATNDYDSGLDGLYLNESSVAFYSKAAANDVVINARPSFEVNDVIPMHFKSNVADTYTFTLNQKEGIFEGTQAVFLRDNYNNNVQNLTLGNYTFSTPAGIFTDRFDIIYQNLLINTNPTLNAKQIIIYNNNQTTFISSVAIAMDSIKIFDIQGRLLFSKSGINDTKTSVNLNFENQVLLFHITSQDGDTIIKKVIN